MATSLVLGALAYILLGVSAALHNLIITVCQSLVECVTSVTFTIRWQRADSVGPGPEPFINFDIDVNTNYTFGQATGTEPH